ncbi:hypothetical protein FS749_016340 [Ceratobasidium sp. UAMH 11750]|nr:hypothetical protein FS749_016340 [Ceratobasidium sp. UAMH 11750]
MTLGNLGLPGGYTKSEMQGLERAHEFSRTGGAYRTLQGTRPQTLAVALTDSPVGLLAWIGEKMYAWADNYSWTPEELITWTMLYWIKGPAGGLRYYKENKVLERENRSSPISDIEFGWSPTPFGYSYFPREIAPLPVDWAGLRQNLPYTNKHNKGGHFAAWEVPDLLMGDIREFTSIMLSKDSRLTNPLRIQ